jgi:hypothetical protein
MAETACDRKRLRTAEISRGVGRQGVQCEHTLLALLAVLDESYTCPKLSSRGRPCRSGLWPTGNRVPIGTVPFVWVSLGLGGGWISKDHCTLRCRPEDDGISERSRSPWRDGRPSAVSSCFRPVTTGLRRGITRILLAAVSPAGKSVERLTRQARCRSAPVLAAQGFTHGAERTTTRRQHSRGADDFRQGV